MFKFIPKSSRPYRNVTTRGGSNTKISIIKNDTEDSEDSEDEDMKKITRENNHIYFHAEVNRDNIFDFPA